MRLAAELFKHICTLIKNIILAVQHILFYALLLFTGLIVGCMFLNISTFSCMASNSLKSCGLMTNTNLIFTIEGEIFNLVFLAFFLQCYLETASTFIKLYLWLLTCMLPIFGCLSKHFPYYATTSDFLILGSFY